MSSLSRTAGEVALHRRPALFRLSGLALSLSLVFGWAGHAQAQETPLSLSDALKTAAFEHPSVAARIKERAGAEARLDVAHRQKLPALPPKSMKLKNNRLLLRQTKSVSIQSGRVGTQNQACQLGRTTDPGFFHQMLSVHMHGSVADTQFSTHFLVR